MRSYQERQFDEIADAIRYVDGTTPPIVALDFADRIRALKGIIGSGPISCHLWDNVPYGCGDYHGLRHLDYSLVNCIVEKLVDFRVVDGNTCLVDENWAYGSPTCEGLHGLLHLDYSLVNCTYPYSVLWGYDYDASK